jgi:putative peptidoglycan lipid II flippase
MGLALAFSISSLTNMFLLLWLLRKRVGYLDDSKIIRSVIKLISMSAVMGGVIWGTKYVMALGINMHTFVGIFIQGIGSAAVGLTCYFIMAIILKCDEIKIITDWLLKLKKQLFNNSKVDSPIS